jgi:hypothetical protein
MVWDDEKRRKYQRERYHRMKRAAKSADEGRIPMIPFNVRVPASLVARMQQIATRGVAMGVYPWKTTQEVARAALSKGIMAIAKDDDALEFGPEMALQDQLMAAERQKTQARAMLGMVRATVKDYLDMNAKDEAARYFDSALDKVYSMPRTAWVQWLIDEMRKAFPDLVALYDADEIPQANPFAVAPRPKDAARDRKEQEAERRQRRQPHAKGAKG